MVTGAPFERATTPRTSCAIECSSSDRPCDDRRCLPHAQPGADRTVVRAGGGADARRRRRRARRRSRCGRSGCAAAAPARSGRGPPGPGRGAPRRWAGPTCCSRRRWPIGTPRAASSRSSRRSWGSEPHSRCDGVDPADGDGATVDLDLGDDRVPSRRRRRPDACGSATVVKERTGRRDSTASPHVPGGPGERRQVTRPGGLWSDMNATSWTTAPVRAASSSTNAARPCGRHDLGQHEHVGVEREARRHRVERLPVAVDAPVQVEGCDGQLGHGESQSSRGPPPARRRQSRVDGGPGRRLGRRGSVTSRPHPVGGTHAMSVSGFDLTGQVAVLTGAGQRHRQGDRAHAGRGRRDGRRRRHRRGRGPGDRRRDHGRGRHRARGSAPT